MRHRNTKIVCTAGPSSHTPEQIARLISAGANVFRLNFSHADHAWHTAALRTIRRVAEELGRPVAVMQDLCGPKIRLSKVAPGKSELVEGDLIRITTDSKLAELAEAPFEFDLASTYASLLTDVVVGGTLLLDDGRVRLEVKEKAPAWIVAQVVRGGGISVGKGLNLPGMTLSTASVTAKDWRDFAWAVEHEIDYIALSFVRHPDDLIAVRTKLDEVGSSAKLIAKIERPEALEYLEEILAVADGLMIARGDLGLETNLAQVPVLQKRMIHRCRKLAKPVITATQMLESMVHDATPTRAEVSDVANAIYDGTDAVMLSGETANGKFPAEAVEVLHQVALVTESDIVERETFGTVRGMASEVPAIVDAAAQVADTLGAKRLVVFSHTGATARWLARHRLPMPVVAVTNDASTFRQLSLLYGVDPVFLPQINSLPQLLAEMDQLVLARHWGRVGDCLVVVSALDGRDGHTDTLHIHHVRQ